MAKRLRENGCQANRNLPMSYESYLETPIRRQRTTLLTAHRQGFRVQQSRLVELSQGRQSMTNGMTRLHVPIVRQIDLVDDQKGNDECH